MNGVDDKQRSMIPVKTPPLILYFRASMNSTHYNLPPRRTVAIQYTQYVMRRNSELITGNSSELY